MTPKRAITSLRVKNFKAVHDSGTLTPGGLTVFIGNNGAGKSSVIEALRFLRALSRSTLDQSLKEFGSYADLRWKGGVHRGRISPTDPDREMHPLEITVHGHLGAAVHQASVRLSGLNQGRVGFDHETLRRGATTLTRTRADEHDLRPEQSLLSRTRYFDDWQHLDLVPPRMGHVESLSGAGVRGHLEADGSNLGEYLLSLQEAEGGAGPAPGGVGAPAGDARGDPCVLLPVARSVSPRVARGLCRPPRRGAGRRTVATPARPDSRSPALPRCVPSVRRDCGGAGVPESTRELRGAPCAISR